MAAASLRSSSQRYSGQPSGLPDPAVEAVRLALMPVGDPVEEVLGRLARRLHLLDRLLDACDTPSRPLPVRSLYSRASVIVDPEAGELQAQVLAGDGLERVRLVEDGHVVLGQQPEARRPAGPGR